MGAAALATLMAMVMFVKVVTAGGDFIFNGDVALSLQEALSHSTAAFNLLFNIAN